LRKRYVSFSSLPSVLKIKSMFHRLVARISGLFGCAVIGVDELKEIRLAIVALQNTMPVASKSSVAVDAPMPETRLKLTDGVKLLSLKIWTEGPRPCLKHAYRPVRASNSHQGSSASSGGKHSDFICEKCTHKMCDTKWGEVNA
jgi:hypothetical protein